MCTLSLAVLHLGKVLTTFIPYSEAVWWVYTLTVYPIAISMSSLIVWLCYRFLLYLLLHNVQSKLLPYYYLRNTSLVELSHGSMQLLSMTHSSHYEAVWRVYMHTSCLTTVTGSSSPATVLCWLDYLPPFVPQWGHLMPLFGCTMGFRGHFLVDESGCGHVYQCWDN